MGKVVFRLKDYLQERGIKPWALENEAQRLGHSLGGSNIYRLLKDDEGPANLNRKTLAVVIETLRSLEPRRKVKVSDLIDYVEGGLADDEDGNENRDG